MQMHGTKRAESTVELGKSLKHSGAHTLVILAEYVFKVVSLGPAPLVAIKNGARPKPGAIFHSHC
jgi:hypothetical protein